MGASDKANVLHRTLERVGVCSVDGTVVGNHTKGNERRGNKSVVLISVFLPKKKRKGKTWKCRKVWEETLLLTPLS